MVVVHRQPDDLPDFRGEPVEQIFGHADQRLDERGPRLDGQGDEVAGNRARPGQAAATVSLNWANAVSEAASPFCAVRTAMVMSASC